MAQEQIQEQQQTQSLKQIQGITQQQLLQAQLIELPVAQLLERVNAEMDDNPALELSTGDDSEYAETFDDADNPEPSDDYEREERQSALDAALESIGRDDEELPVYHG
jgi:RNA polymerase sigma-54 factor